MKVKEDLDLQQICKQVCNLVQDVSVFLEEENKRFSKTSVEHKGFNNLVSYVDQEAERKLVTGCKKIFPKANFLTEEGTVAAVESGENELTWIIDPLDGTTNFVHKLPMFAISVGLVRNGQPILGVVAHVPNHQLFYAWEGGGAWCNGQRISVSNTDKLSDSLLATGFPYFEFDQLEAYLRIIHNLTRKSHGLRRIGSAAIDMAYVACGIFEGFFEYNLSPWDVAAGICLVREAGGTTTDFAGKDNALFGRQMVAAGPVHPEFLAEIKTIWESHPSS
jgi:myo-inositol-1(or 4)-monophosphatase